MGIYISKKKHIISETLFISSCITIVMLAVNGAVRWFLHREVAITPVMLESMIFRMQKILGFIEIVLVSGLFYAEKNRLTKIQQLFNKDEQKEIAQLQTEYNINGVSSIDVDAMAKLMSIWAIILIGARIVYEIMADLYTDFVGKLFFINSTNDPVIANALVSIYNNTHGFKYIGMFISINIGIFVTGVFLKDQYLKLFAIMLSIVFLIVACLSNMTSIEIFNKTIGVVWTSVLFHLLQTFGLMYISVYLAVKHKGM